MNRSSPHKVLPGVSFDLEWAASGHENPDGSPATAPVHLQPAEKPFVLLVRPCPRVELDPANVVVLRGRE